MSRHRVGVALLLEGRTGAEIDGLRRALGCRSLHTQSPHITLVPPVNVREDALGDALAVVRRAAAAVRGPLRVSLGPVATFAPETPVLFLAVSEPTDAGDEIRPGQRAALDALQCLHAAVNAAPLLRPVDRLFVPHVTVHTDADPALIPSALGLLGSFRADVVIDRLFLLEQGPDRIWRRLADVPLGAPTVRGRGGVELAMRVCRLIAPDVGAALGSALVDSTMPPDPAADERSTAGRTVIEARTADVPVAVAAWHDEGPFAVLDVLVVDETRRREGIGSQVLSEVYSVAAAAGRSAIRLDLATAAKAGPWAHRWLREQGWKEDAHLVPPSLVRTC